MKVRPALYKIRSILDGMREREAREAQAIVAHLLEAHRPHMAAPEMLERVVGAFDVLARDRHRSLHDIGNPMVGDCAFDACRVATCSNARDLISKARDLLSSVEASGATHAAVGRVDHGDDAVRSACGLLLSTWGHPVACGVYSFDAGAVTCRACRAAIAAGWAGGG